MRSTPLCLQSSGSNEGENMDAPLQDCTVEEQRGAVRFVLGGRRSETCGNSPSYVGSVWTEQRESTEGLNRVEHVSLMKVVLVGHQHRARKTTRAAEKLLLRRNTETS